MQAFPRSKALQFFKNALVQGAFGHAYLLTGQDTQHQYDIALYLAQLLNCEAPVSSPSTGEQDPCHHCRPCKWILAAAHPIVKTISRLSFEDEDSLRSKKDKNAERKQISTQQVKSLQHYLSKQAAQDEHRIIIFTDAQKVPLSSQSKTQGIYPVPYEWSSEPKNEKYTLAWQPLTRQIFSDAAANRFLKNLEEPPERTHYFFLTRHVESLLPTIVSRCQVVYIPPPLQALPHTDTSLPESLITWMEKAFSPFHALEVLPLLQSLEAEFKAENIPPIEGVRALEAYLKRSPFKVEATRYVAWQNALAQAENDLTHTCNVSNTLWCMLDNLT